jgi:hypothetical protein
VCENWVLKEWMTLSGRKREKDIKNCIRRDYMICALHKVLFLSDLLMDDKMGRIQHTSSNNECVNSFVLNNSWEGTISETKARRDYMICALHKVFFLSDLLKDNKMGRMQPTSSNNKCVNSFVLNSSWEGTISETKAWIRQQSQNGSNTA